MPRLPPFRVFAAALLLTGCSTGPERAPSLGVAWVGPAKVTLRAEIDTKSPAVTVVNHGDRLDIVGRRRSSWYRVRTASGLEGWTSDRELLDAAQMERLRRLAADTAGLPPQGVASSFSVLNVHILPNRQSASFVQVAEKEKFEVLAHRVAERVPLPRRQLIPEAPKTAPKSTKKAAKKVPKSAETAASAPPPAPSSAPAAAAAPPALDDWTLIRTRGGQTGWVLTNAVYMEIPDEVAQYAEGHRITSYFSLGKIRDGDAEKDIWLWTTAEQLDEDHDFDSYRVFVWSLRRHRYETAYIQRRERGFLPVIAKPGEFSVCLEKTDGTRVRRRYVLLNTSVRPAGETACEVPSSAHEEDIAPPQHLTDAAPDSPTPGILDRMKASLRRLIRARPR